MEHSCSKRDTTCGTSLYMAPEVYEGGAELKSDVWSLGISLIELAEGKNPYAEYTSAQVMNRVINKEPPSLSSSKWSAAFVDFVAKCLVKDVEERWGVKQLMEEMDKGVASVCEGRCGENQECWQCGDPSGIGEESRKCEGNRSRKRIDESNANDSNWQPE